MSTIDVVVLGPREHPGGLPSWRVLIQVPAAVGGNARSVAARLKAQGAHARACGGSSPIQWVEVDTDTTERRVAPRRVRSTQGAEATTPGRRKARERR